MNQSHYLLVLEYEYQTKNRLQKAVLEYFRSIDRMLIQASELEKFKAEIISQVQKLNQEYKACRSVNIYYHPEHPNKFDLGIQGFHGATIKIRAGVETFFGMEYKSLSNN